MSAMLSQPETSPAANSETARAPANTAWTSFWKQLFRFQRDKIDVWLGLRNALGVSLPLAGGVAFGMVPGGLAMSTGALNVSFSDLQEPYPQRAARMCTASALVGFAVFAGALCGHNDAVSIAIAAIWAFATGLLVALGTSAADLGNMSLVTLVVYMAVPQTPERAVYGGLLACGGGLLQTLISLSPWPLRRYVHERGALGDLFIELARMAAAPVQVSQAPPASAQSTRAQTVFASLANDHAIQAERYRSLLSQAERMRIGLLALGRLRIRIAREGSPQSSALDRYFDVCAGLLRSIGEALELGQSPRQDPHAIRELQDLSEEFRRGGSQRTPAASALILDARSQMDALLGQLRSALDLAAHATPQGSEEFERAEAKRPWKLRLAGPLATLKANLHLRSTAFRHALRLAASIAIGEALARGFHLERPYWIPMTVAIVLKPDFAATYSRGALRIAGTLAGAALATALFHLLDPALFFQAALVGIFMFFLRCIGPANYGLFVAAVTGLVVFLISMTGVSPAPVLAARAWNTILGGAIALLAYGLWPTWERTQIRESVARMLDAYRDYFRIIRLSYESPQASFARERDHVRLAARLARSNVEASIDRMGAEPGASPATMHVLSGMLAGSHRLAHAIMALEAGLSSGAAAPGAEFQAFANDVELTLYYLAAALRGSRAAPSSLPDLREDHGALMRSAQLRKEPYALVVVETDRITNSLNTLAELALQFVNATTSTTDLASSP